MFPVMSSAHRINGFLFCILIMAMLVYSAPKILAFSESNPGALDLFINGKLSRQFEHAYDREFFLRSGAINQWANLQYRLFGEASSGALLGQDGWIFSNEEYLFPVSYEANLNEHMERIAQVSTALTQQGKSVILVPIPMKADIYSEYSPYDIAPRARRLYQDFMHAAAQRQLQVVDTRETLLAAKTRGDVFIPRDTHWSALGANQVARKVARDFPQLTGNDHFVTRQQEEKVIQGDLRNFVRFDAELAPQYFSEYRIAVYQTEAVADADAANSEDALFSDSSTSIALVGTSYSSMEDWNFSGFLKQALAADIVMTAFESYGTYYAMDQFQASDLSQDPAITTVIWEIPLRTLIRQHKKENNWQGKVQSLF